MQCKSCNKPARGTMVETPCGHFHHEDCIDPQITFLECQCGAWFTHDHVRKWETSDPAPSHTQTYACYDPDCTGKVTVTGKNIEDCPHHPMRCMFCKSDKTDIMCILGELGYIHASCYKNMIGMAPYAVREETGDTMDAPLFRNRCARCFVQFQHTDTVIKRPCGHKEHDTCAEDTVCFCVKE